MGDGAFLCRGRESLIEHETSRCSQVRAHRHCTSNKPRLHVTHFFGTGEANNQQFKDRSRIRNKPPHAPNLAHSTPVHNKTSYLIIKLRPSEEQSDRKRLCSSAKLEGYTHGKVKVVIKSGLLLKHYAFEKARECGEGETNM